MKGIFTRFLIAFFFLANATVQAQISVTPAMNYTQNFDGYLGNNATTMPAGWTVTGSFTFRGQGTGTSNSGGSWAFGAGTDRSLGYLGSGTSPNITYTVSFTNNTGTTITQLNISYDFEQWRFAGGNTNGWTVSGTGALATTLLNGLNTNSALSGPTGIGTTIPKSISLTGLSIAPGAAFGMKWTCSDGAGNDNGIAIDNYHLVLPCTPSTPLIIDTTLCAGGTFTWNGSSYTTAQQLQHTFTNIGGCDSLVTVNLGFHPIITHAFSDTVCFGQNYPWGTQTPNATGTYTQVFNAASNCDSTVTLHLFVRPQITHAFADTVCFGQNYPWGTQTPNATGTYTQVFNAASNCDSTVTLHLFVRPQITHAFADTVCFGQNYPWGTQTPNTTGTYTQVFNAATNCDSTVTLHLFVRPQITHAFADTVCFGQNYPWGTQTPNATGTYTQVFNAASNCDSTVTLHLFVRSQITHTFADTVCFGQNYPWGTQTQNATGTYTQVFNAATNCDSTVTLHLFVRPQITHAFADTVCFGQNYPWGTQNQNTTGTYNQTFTAFSGCDSIVTLHLFVRSQITHTFADTVCFGQNYPWGTQTPNATGTYTQVFNAASNCDSTVTLHLFVRSQITHTFADTVCFGQSYPWGTQTQNATGTYTQVFNATSNCDSTVTLHLFVRPQITYAFADTVCFGQNYPWGTQAPNATGTYTQVFNAATNCDSTVTLHLFIRPQITHAFADTVCFGQNYPWGTQTPNATGTYTQVFNAVTNCDSTVTLHLFIRPQITHAFADTVCFGQNYPWGTQAPSATGTYIQVFNAATNCDSTVILHLFVRPQITNSITATICNGATYVLGTQSLTTAGTYIETFTASSGCDSMVTLNLNVNPVITNTVAVSICNGTSYSWGSQTLNTTGTYNQTFPSSGICDSVVTLTLTVLPPVTNSISTAICNGSSYTFGSQNLNTSGTYSQVFTAANGCDSTVTLALTVKPAITHAAQVFICPGTSYTFGPQVLSVSGVYSQIFTAADGCDSTVTLTLSVSGAATSKVIDTAACGQVNFEGTAYFNTVTLHDTLSNIHGCDSLYRTIHITVHNNTPVQVTIDTSGCGLVLFEGNTYQQTTVLHHMFTSIYGCDSLDRTVNINVMQAHSDTTRAAICQGGAYPFYSQTYNTAGTYKVTFPNPQGCDFNFVLVLEVNRIPVAAFESITPGSFCIGDSIELRAKGDYRYLWTNSAGTTLGTGDHMMVYLHNGASSFNIEASDDNGCKDTAFITVAAQPCCSVWMPNAFSPNGDGLNDKFMPQTHSHPSEYVLHIFNRWGQMVYSSFNISEGWDGNINGKPAALDTYYYRISGKCVNGEAWEQKGELTLVR